MIKTPVLETSNQHPAEENKNLINKVISLFTIDGKEIEGIYDLLIRGAISKEVHTFVPNWSDLDLSIIVEDVNVNVLKQTRRLYQKIKIFFPYKLSITTVSTKDFFSHYHHHGIKPIYYSQQLASAISLLRRQVFANTVINLRDMRLDCLANITYLIHELRSSFIKLDSTSDTRNFFCHLAKRGKQLVRNCLFILTECDDEEIDQRIFQKYFTEANPNFPSILKSYKTDLQKQDLENQIKPLIDETFGTLETIYAQFITYIENQALFEKD